MTWRTIEDLPEDRGRLELAELRSLDALWHEKRAELEDLDGMRIFRERLVRSWAIETGVIERVYDLDRGTTELLIEHGIDASLIDRTSTDKEPELVARIIEDQREAIEGLFDFIKQDRELSTSYVKELHAALTRSQTEVDALDQFGNLVKVPFVRGDWKRMPNNPRRPDGTLHVYCPPEQVASEMDRLIELHLQHSRQRVAAEVEAAWLHHRFTQIHPFQDGNGRVARTLASLIFLRAGWFPLTVDRDRKPEYIECLEAADLGELRYLSRFFGQLQRDELVRALGIGDQAVRELEGLEQVIRAARDDLLRATPREQEELNRVRGIADALQGVALEELEAVKSLIDREISDYRPEFSTRVERADASGDRAHWYFGEIVEIAQREFHYFANPRTYAAWVRLRIADRDASTWDDFIISFHGVGREFRGLVAVTAFHNRYQIGSERGKKDRRRTHSRRISDELFQINYREEPEQVTARFREWLHGVMTIGLGQWRSSLPAGRGSSS